MLFSLFQYLFAPWHFWLDNCPAHDILLGLAILCLYGIVGYLFLRCLDVYFPRVIEFALALVLGIAILTIPFELLAIFGLLYQGVVALMFVVFIALFGYFSIRHQHSPMHGAPQRSDVVLFRRGYLFFAHEELKSRVQMPSSKIGLVIYYTVMFVIGLIVVLNFYHALLYPETYWDALIYYMGYGRMTFLQHKFPVKVVAQVGLGLGANYPHLFPLLGATMSTLAGKWANSFSQLIPPVAGLIATILVYHTVARLTGVGLIAALSTLLFRSVPYGIAYFTFASDYAIALLFTSAFLYLALLYIDTRLWGYLVMMTVICAGAVHLNYLMWYLWLGWAVVLVVAHWRAEKQNTTMFQPATLPLTRNQYHPTLKNLLSSRRFICLLIIAIIVSLVWYVRNIVVTGNPFYAFFPHILGGKNINPEVLKSCFNEWYINGDGIGKFGKGLWEKLRYSWVFFVTWQHSWKLAPVFMGFGVAGFLIALLEIVGLIHLFPSSTRKHTHSFLIINTYIFMFLLFYHYCISDIYLYHIVPILVPVAIFSALVLKLLWGRGVKIIPILFCLYIGIIPGIAMSLMGFKFTGIAEFAGRKVAQSELVALRNPCIPEQMFYRLQYGKDVDMWRYVNTHLKGKKLLTHENRMLVYDPSITFIHLDDWEIQQLYGLKDAEKLRQLKSMNIHYYLYVPMEDKHPVVKKLGHHRWIRNQKILVPVFRAGRNVLYQFVYTDKGIPEPTG
ncbi:glycosyltransferase family 39 protein [Candidatus Sumerlaeota bacterium]|nr:glycosyltransferase family 39 protein [Candidatus Sumerlaeota bacterium]